ncbi:unnamed protein product [Schistosoma curassoni]|uniref:Uncharacterized protein n=1 Tax=Schistosoma curassoni TaxID=6186 RepID=A0A183KJQ4_9TREM|nr:unnamed protein product [Schistosoma curassoni]
MPLLPSSAVGFQVKACLVMQFDDLCTVCPIHFHHLFLISSSVGIWNAVLALPILTFTSTSNPHCSSMMLPSYMKDFTSSSVSQSMLIELVFSIMNYLNNANDQHVNQSIKSMNIPEKTVHSLNNLNLINNNSESVIKSKLKQTNDKTVINQSLISMCAIGLNIYKGKSRILRYNTECTNPITIDEEDLEDVKTFTYLGSIIDEHGGSDAHVKARIGKARTAYLQLKNIWNSKQMSANQHQGQDFQCKCQHSSTNLNQFKQKSNKVQSTKRFISKPNLCRLQDLCLEDRYKLNQLIMKLAEAQEALNQMDSKLKEQSIKNNDIQQDNRLISNQFLNSEACSFNVEQKEYKELVDYLESGIFTQYHDQCAIDQEKAIDLKSIKRTDQLANSNSYHLPATSASEELLKTISYRTTISS